MTTEPRKTEPPHEQDQPETRPRGLNFFQTLKSVAWGFFGVRKRASHQEDAEGLNPGHLIIAGLLAAAIFVLVLLLIIRWVVPVLT